VKGKRWAALAVFALVVALLPLSAVPAVAGSGPAVFINEFHYDNASTDTGEAIEIAGPAGTDLTGWSIVLYNGNGGASYNTTALSGSLNDDSNGYGFMVVTYPSNGIQNGSPDGIALVDGTTVVQFLSYEGSFVAVGGPADGMTSTDIGVAETSSTPAGDSLQLQGTGTTYDDFTWGGPVASTFGSVNFGQAFGMVVLCSNITTPPGTAASSQVEATDPDGVVTDMSLMVDPATDSISLTSFVAATETGGTATADVSVSAEAPAGVYDAVVTASSSSGKAGSCALKVIVANSVSIHDIQYTTDSSGDSPYEDEFLMTEGVVTGVFGSSAFIQDGTGSWSGLYLYNPSTGVSVGDAVQVAGTVSEYYGLTEIGGGDLWTIGTADVPAPEVLATADIGQEQWESVFVRAEDATVTAAANSHGEWEIDDSSGPVMVDDLGYHFEPVSGSQVLFVQGPLYYSFGNFLIEPRDSEDVSVVTPIGVVQGTVTDTDNGLTFESPFVGDYVTIKAVVTQKLLSRSSSGGDSWAYFLQNTTTMADGNPDSSDGIYLYTGYYDNVWSEEIGWYYTPKVGDELILRAPVSEYYDLTELYGGDATIVEVVRTGVDLDAEVPAFLIDPPNNLDDANRYWERHEGMRAQIPANSTTLSGRDVFASSLDAEVWLAAPDSPISDLTGYEARAFRDGRNLADAEGNGFRIVLGSLGLKAAADDNTAMIAPVRTFDTITNSPIGGVYFSYGKYQIQIGEQLEYADGDDPSDNYPPMAPDLSTQYSITTFNMENLYDYRDDPFDGCDFLGNSGCPGVYPPFDYAPGSPEAYELRVAEIAAQVVENLHSPDIVLAQEIEDQDICTLDGWTLECGTTTETAMPDGKPDALEDLAIAIHDLGGPSYDSAFDRNGADDRGITAAFLFRSDRVEMPEATPDNPVLGSDPTVDYPGGLSYNYEVSNPKALNADLPDWVDTSTGTDGDLVFTRAPQVGYFLIWVDGVGNGLVTGVYAISNHFSSTPDARVGQRTEQAAYNAAIVEALQAYDPSVRVVVGGDLNVYPDSGQLAALYDQGLINLYYTLLAADPYAAYSYVYQGQAQTLDQLFLTPSVYSDFVEMRAAHINSDFPADHVGDGPRGTSDHDPQVALVTSTEHSSVTLLEGLVQYYSFTGMVTGNKTVKILLDRLERARRYLEKGKTAAYMAQLQSFTNQVQGFAPQFVDQDVADILSYYAELLMDQ
jgi:predicted extracellular nuclease